MKNIVFNPTDRDAIYEYVVDRHYFNCNKNSELDALKAYISAGNVDDFLQNGGQVIDPSSVIYLGANLTLENIKDRIGKLWLYLERSKNDYNNHLNFPKTGSLNEWCVSGIKSLSTRNYGRYLDNDVYSDMFKFVYGARFNNQHKLDIECENQNVEFMIDVDPTSQFALLLGGISRHLFHMEQEYTSDPARVTGLYDYFFSCLPYIDNNIFSIKRYPRRHKNDNGKLSNYSSKQARLRYFIGWTYGVLERIEIEHYKFEKVRVCDDDELQAFKNKFETLISCKEEYFALVDFIKEAGPDYIDASSD